MRLVPATAGILVLAAAWLAAPLGAASAGFATHMAVHMAVVAVAAPLLAAGLAGGRFDPVRRWPALFAPVPISIADFVLVWTWHAPALQAAARDSALAWGAEQASFLAGGLALWLAAAGGAREARRSRRAAGVVALLFTSMHMTLLGAIFALAPRAVYAASGAHATALAPHAALADQHLGGAIMIAAGVFSYLAGGLWLTAGLLRPVPR